MTASSPYVIELNLQHRGSAGAICRTGNAAQRAQRRWGSATQTNTSRDCMRVLLTVDSGSDCSLTMEVGGETGQRRGESGTMTDTRRDETP